eukprot:584722-Amphidinium_carterae.3
MLTRQTQMRQCNQSPATAPRKCPHDHQQCQRWQSQELSRSPPGPRAIAVTDRVRHRPNSALGARPQREAWTISDCGPWHIQRARVRESGYVVLAYEEQPQPAIPDAALD